MLALTTVCLFAWFGLSTLAMPLWDGSVFGVQPAVGHLLLGLAALRLAAWIRELWHRRASD